jgi:DNA primase
MDAISCFQAGVNNVIASLGTSLTENHIKLLKRYTNEVVIAYDSDKAGAEATSRGLNLLIKGDIKVKILLVPSGKDPDDFIRENGAEAFGKLVSSAVDLVEYKIDRINKQTGINNADGKKQAVSDLVITLASMGNQVERSEYVKKCAERLNVEEDYIWQELAKAGAAKKIERSTQPTIKASPKRGAKETIEQRLIECLIQNPQFIQQSRVELRKEDFSNACHIELIELLWNNLDENKGGVELGNLINKCSSKESRDIVSNIISSKMTVKKNLLPEEEKTEAVFNGCIKKMIDFRDREYRLSIRKENTEDKITASRKLMDSRNRNKNSVIH